MARNNFISMWALCAEVFFIICVQKKDGKVVERNTLSVLDFYVSEPHQRHGIGAALFSSMLCTTGAEPAKLAYDRPSPKLSAFLR